MLSFKKIAFLLKFFFVKILYYSIYIRSKEKCRQEKNLFTIDNTKKIVSKFSVSNKNNKPF